LGECVSRYTSDPLIDYERIKKNPNEITIAKIEEINPYSILS